MKLKTFCFAATLLTGLPLSFAGPATAQHVCRSESAGNRGPGWSKSRITEVSGVDRKHLVGTEDN